MRKSAWIAALWLVAAPVLAGDFTDSATGGSCNNGIYPGKCCQATIESDLTDITIDTHRVESFVLFDMDDDGATSGTVVDLYSCVNTNETQANCNPLKWDTDGDGVVDSNRLDGNTDMKRGLMSVQVPAILVDPISHTQDARILVCGVAS